MAAKRLFQTCLMLVRGVLKTFFFHTFNSNETVFKLLFHTHLIGIK